MILRRLIPGAAGLLIMGIVCLNARAYAERPLVEVVEHSAHLNGPQQRRRPQWDRVRLVARVVNRLDVAITALNLRVLLVRPGAGRVKIPGWSFDERLVHEVWEAGDERIISIDRPLTPRKVPPRAEEIAYRIEVTSYRLVRPRVDTALRLLARRPSSDQRAALFSFSADHVRPSDRKAIEAELALTLQQLPMRPDASDALRLLFVIRALGALKSARHIPDLVYLVDRVDRAAWGRALMDLDETMTAASRPEEPRLELLPSWAQRPPELLAVRTDDALFDAVRNAVRSIGARSVAPLMFIAHDDPRPERKNRAKRLLASIGRSSIQSQLRVREPAAKILVVDALGQLRRTEAIPALLELAMQSRGPLQVAAQNALVRIGPAALEPLAKALGPKDSDALRSPLLRLSTRFPASLRKIARQFGIDVAQTGDPRAIIERLFVNQGQKYRRQLEGALQAALALGRQASYRRALEELDRIYARDPDLYRRHASSIAEIYAGRAQKFVDRGDFEAAAMTAEAGRSVADTRELQAVVFDARRALARGYLELGELDRSQRQIELLRRSAPGYAGRVEALRQTVLVARVRQALKERRTAEARALLEQVDAPVADRSTVRSLRWAIRIADNVSIVLLVGLIGALAILVGAAILFARLRNRPLRQGLREGAR